MIGVRVSQQGADAVNGFGGGAGEHQRAGQARQRRSDTLHNAKEQ